MGLRMISTGDGRGRISRRGLMTAGAAGVLTATAAAASTAPATPQMAASGTLRIAIPAFHSPPFFSAASEPERGIDFDMSRALAAALRVAPVFDRSANTFDDAVNLLVSGAADVAVCKLSRTLNRGRMVLYSRPYATLHHGLVANRVRLAHIAGGAQVEDVIRDFRGELGVIARSSFAEFAAASFPSANIHEFADWAGMVDAVRSERIDLAYRDDFEIKRLLVDDPSLTVVARSITLTDRTDTLAVAVRADAAHLASFVDLFLELRSGAGMLSTDDIVARYRAERGV